MIVIALYKSILIVEEDKNNVKGAGICILKRVYRRREKQTSENQRD